MSARSRTDRDLTPLPVWRQHVARLAAAWRRSKDRRHRACGTLVSAGIMLLTLAISTAGATLISYGVYRIYEPAGYIAGGFMCWLLLWSHERDKGRRE